MGGGGGGPIWIKLDLTVDTVLKVSRPFMPIGGSMRACVRVCVTEAQARTRQRSSRYIPGTTVTRKGPRKRVTLQTQLHHI